MADSRGDRRTRPGGAAGVRGPAPDTDGRIYCEYYGPDAESIREHARRAGPPVDRIAEVTLEISPAMFR